VDERESGESPNATKPPSSCILRDVRISQEITSLRCYLKRTGVRTNTTSLPLVVLYQTHYGKYMEALDNSRLRQNPTAKKYYAVLNPKYKFDCSRDYSEFLNGRSFFEIPSPKIGRRFLY
jgi:hypothetical protein